MQDVQLTVLAGGVGAARFLAGLRLAAPEADVTVVGNTGDDIELYGLRVCPDLDSVMYRLGGGASEERGWGRADETFVVREELAGYGAPNLWFTLGDRDLATHLTRRALLDGGATLSEATTRLCERWQPGVRLVPMTDETVATQVLLADGRRVHFQEWWVRLRAAVPATGFELDGAMRARPAPGVVPAIAQADVVLLPPSNPVVSIGTILRVPGIREALRTTRAPVVGVSPIVAGAPVSGMADACLQAIGVEVAAAAVAMHYGARAAGGLLDGWLVDTSDAQVVDGLAAAGIRARALPLLMTDARRAADIARAALDLAIATTG